MSDTIAFKQKCVSMNFAYENLEGLQAALKDAATSVSYSTARQRSSDKRQAIKQELKF